MLYWHRKRMERQELIRKIIADVASVVLGSAVMATSIVAVLAFWVVFGY